MDLKYENPTAALAPSGTSVIPQYGGNISQVVWQVRGRERQAYTLSYDSESRMTSAKYSDISYSGTVTGGRYDETLTYDIRGNIQTLQRYGLTSVAGAPSPTWGLIDNLTYNYGASDYNPKNQLQSVIDESGNLTKGFKTVANGSTYTYDTNGNMTADPNKGITSIAYNHMNLPTTITFTNSRSIAFLYDAGGNKLRKTVVQSGVTQYTQDYVGGIEYRTASNVTTLEAIYHAEGRVTTINSVLKYEYALKDHLGNTRIMFSDKNGDGLIQQSTNQETSEVTQENHYYPFGMNMEGNWQNTPSVTDSKYLYNGKEMNDDFGLGLMDYGARFYDAALAKWHSFDPLAEIYNDYSPYHYVLNNPMRYIDPNGMGHAPAAPERQSRDIWGNTTILGSAGLSENIGGKNSNCDCPVAIKYSISANGKVNILNNQNVEGYVGSIDYILGFNTDKVNIPTSDPDYGYLTTGLKDIQNLEGKPLDPTENRAFVYQLIAGPSTSPLNCKSCKPPRAEIFYSGEIYKYGIAKDQGDGFFETAVLGRYHSFERGTYGITGFNFSNLQNPSANITAVNMTSAGPIPRSQALLLEKILIFNHALFKIQSTELAKRGIVTNRNLPPGNVQLK